MTIDEFLDEFKKISKEYNFKKWRYTIDAIRGYKETNLVFIPKIYCPITAVCVSKGNVYFYLDGYKTAAKMIGLNPGERDLIIEATDNRNLEYCYGFYIAENVRKNMLEIINGT